MAMTAGETLYKLSLAELHHRYDVAKGQAQKNDLTRGKPSVAQLDLAKDLLKDTHYLAEDGFDCRNYGLPEGLPEARRLAAEILGTPYKNTLVVGNSSLQLMHHLVTEMMLRPLPDAHHGSWKDMMDAGVPVSMICPTPAYDRHHAICAHYGIRMIPVPMRDDGPDLTGIEARMGRDNILGMWCIPKYSNPTGTTYSRQKCEEIAKLFSRYPGSRVIWDLAYQVHELTDTPDTLPTPSELCKMAKGREDWLFVVGSTSKITMASAGIAFLALSDENRAWFLKSLTTQMIGSDKVNQLRHVRFLKNLDGVKAHMELHRSILAPKFAMVDRILTREFSGSNTVRWNKPKGGYFINLTVKHGCARRVVALCATLGLSLTPAGAAYPDSVDPHDEHIRIAPSVPSLQAVESAMESLVLAIHLAQRE
jgi:DNA-binding transcriptional MocR family regulator